jgi:hypothetical protein
MASDSGARNVGPKEARVDLHPFKVKQSGIEVNFHSTPHAAYNWQKLDTTSQQGVHTESFYKIKARNLFYRRRTATDGEG